LVHVENSKNKVDENIVNQWKDDFEGLGVVFHLLKGENTYQTILNFIDSYKVDMVAMLHYKKGFFQELFQQSMTQKLSYHSKIPVLSIHEKVL
jgi:nucleotide-binding universal stress UspA family protein